MADERTGGAAEIAELRRVLVPTDFSPFGMLAIPYAYGIAARGGSVHLIHVIEETGLPNPLYAHYTPSRRPTPDERERQLEDLRRKLLALAPEPAELRGVHTHAILGEGEDVARVVCETAERIAADAICLASHGRSGIAKVVLGSRAEKIFECARCPVLIVRPRTS